ncbi:hypothetical protein LCGC14_1792220, partial [marine sediment metagenome]
QEEAMTLGDRIVVMKDGLVQQVGSPLEVYDGPANRFVAGFVGTPPMNFLQGQLVAENGGVLFDEGTFRIRLVDSQAAVLGDWTGKQIILGIRPEAMAGIAQGRFAGTDNTIPAQISVVEPLGEKVDLYLATANHPALVARVDARRDLAAGQDIQLHLDMTKVHVFAPDDEGSNLTLAAELAAVN